MAAGGSGAAPGRDGAWGRLRAPSVGTPAEGSRVDRCSFQFGRRRGLWPRRQGVPLCGHARTRGRGESPERVLPTAAVKSVSRPLPALGWRPDWSSRWPIRSPSEWSRLARDAGRGRDRCRRAAQAKVSGGLSRTPGQTCWSKVGGAAPVPDFRLSACRSEVPERGSAPAFALGVGLSLTSGFRGDQVFAGGRR